MVRAHADRALFEKQKESATRVQRAARGRAAKKHVEDLKWHRDNGNDPNHLEALEVVHHLLALNEGPSTAPKVAHEILTEDFPDEFDLPTGGKHTTVGLRDYLENVNFLVFDEADRLLTDESFQGDLKVIMKTLESSNDERQTFLFSATMASDYDRYLSK